MGNTIQAELKLAKSKMIEETEYYDMTLVKLTRDNVAIVEAMIRNDSAYIHSTNVNACPIYKKNGEIKYGGSSAYWMTLLKNALINDRLDDGYSYEEIIKGAVEAVDRENSTHINADKQGRSEISSRIIEFDLLLIGQGAIHLLRVSFAIMLVFMSLKGLIIKIIIRFMIVFLKRFFLFIWDFIK